jgi:arylsulfatase A-like enzyme
MQAQPNIVLFLADQLRRGALGCYGATDAATPHLDRLASEGVAFTAACSSFPVCVPYRFTLMTGESALTRDVPCLGWRMSPAERTLADEFNEAGYDTAWIGKWHLFGKNPEEDGYVPPAYRGRFGYWEGFEKVNDHFTTPLYRGDDPKPQLYDGFQTDVLTDRALAWLEARKTGAGRKRGAAARRPYFLVVSVEPPHPPLEAPDAYREKRLVQAPDLPPNFMHRETDTGPEPQIASARRGSVIRNRQIYQAMVDNLDDNVGRLLAGLEHGGLADNTVVLFTADHGQMDGAHALPNVIKRLPFEESIGVPLIVRDPRRRASAGRRAGEVVGSEDMFPTLLGLAGIAGNKTRPGFDLGPLIDDPNATLDRAGLLLYLTHHFVPDHPWYRRAWRGIRTRERMFSCWGPRAAGLKPWHLFDMNEDPYQMRNLVAADRAAVDDFRQRLRQMMASHGDHLAIRDRD